MKITVPPDRAVTAAPSDAGGNALSKAVASAHNAVDRAASAAAPTANWLSDQGERMIAAEQRIVADAREYASVNPWKIAAVALAAGLLIGRLMH